MGEVLGLGGGPNITSQGLRTVSSSHSDPKNNQASVVILTEEEIPRSVVSWSCQGLPGRMEWAHYQRPPASDV
jgi:hypothetical protein